MAKSKFLEIALEAVKKAEEIILKYYSDGTSVSLKKDQTPVTLVDIEAENIIKKIIQREFPDHDFLGEEFGGGKKKAKYLWIIDPIDGTKNYIRKIPIFATQVALMRDNEIIVGVSNAPALKELLYAEKNSGAYFNNKKIIVSGIAILAEAHLSFGGLKYFGNKNLTANLMSLSNEVRSTRSFGEFWAYHLLAQGKIDIVVEADIKIWDIAALKVIIEEAGGEVTDIFGEPIGLASTSFLATNGKLHNLVLKAFND